MVSSSCSRTARERGGSWTDYGGVAMISETGVGGYLRRTSSTRPGSGSYPELQTLQLETCPSTGFQGLLLATAEWCSEGEAGVQRQRRRQDGVSPTDHAREPWSSNATPQRGNGGTGGSCIEQAIRRGLGGVSLLFVASELMRYSRFDSAAVWSNWHLQLLCPFHSSRRTGSTARALVREKPDARSEGLLL